MNCIRKFIFLLSLTSLPVIGGDLFAQTGNKEIFSLSPVSVSGQESNMQTDANSNMRLGYCTTEYSVGLIAQISGSHSYHAAVQFPKEILNKYIGNKIDSIEFAIKPKRGNMAEIFVCTNLKDMVGTTLTKGVSFSYQEGWNKIKFNTPVTIKKDMNLYIGYVLHLNDGEDYDCLLFDKGAYSVPGKNWYGYDGQWFNNTAGINKNICIRAVISGNKVPDNDISLMKLSQADGGQYVEQNKPKRYTAYIQNNGKKHVNSISVVVSSKGVNTAEFMIDGLDVPNNEPQKIDLDNISIPVEGNYTATFTITKVNGVTDPDDSDNMAEDKGFSIKEGTGPVERTVLFEEFTSEGFDGCAKADSVYSKALENRNDIIRVKHHRNYQSHNDQFVIPEDADYTELYGNSNIFVPAVCVDRLIVSGLEDPGPAYFIDEEQMLNQFFNLAKGIYSFVSLGVEPTITDNNLEVKINGHAGTNEMPLQTDLRLVTWLVEDSIVSTQQAGKDRFIQNGVLRKVLSNSAWGDALDISGYDFKKTYSVALKPEWNVNNLRVVSFVGNYDPSSANRIVYNTAQALCKAPTGITHTGANNDNYIYIIGNSLFAADGYKLAGTYDLSGRSVPADNLSQGIYVVKVTDGNRVFTQKICIKK